MNDLFLEEIVRPDAEVSHGGRSARRTDRVARERKRRRRRRRNLVALAFAVVVIGGGVYAFKAWGLPLIDSFRGGAAEGTGDFAGPGSGSVDVAIPAGAVGVDMARIMTDAGVVASTGAFTQAYEENADAGGIQPGTYRLLLKMRAADAVAALIGSDNRVQTKVTIPEGQTEQQILDKLVSVTAIPLTEFQAAMADPAAVGLPAEANGDYEGWLFPTSYTFEPSTAPAQMIAAMIAQTVQVLDARGIDPADRQRILTVSSLVERESPDPTASPTMARAIQNRLDLDMPLQIDAAVAYGLNKPGDALTLDDISATATENAYNTYAHAGLPPSPIASPGEASIDAVLNPADGSWLFWCTINLETGETLFADTYAEQLENQKLLEDWEAANAG